MPEEMKEDRSDIELWAKFINAEQKEEFDMLPQKNPYIESAYEHLQVISQDKEKRLAYEAREKAIRDQNQLITEAEQRGRETREDRISKLNRILISKGQYDKLAKASEDKAYREEQLRHYGIQNESSLYRQNL